VVRAGWPGNRLFREHVGGPAEVPGGGRGEHSREVHDARPAQQDEQPALGHESEVTLVQEALVLRGRRGGDEDHAGRVKSSSRPQGMHPACAMVRTGSQGSDTRTVQRSGSSRARSALPRPPNPTIPTSHSLRRNEPALPPIPYFRCRP